MVLLFSTLSLTESSSVDFDLSPPEELAPPPAAIGISELITEPNDPPKAND